MFACLFYHAIHGIYNKGIMKKLIFLFQRTKTKMKAGGILESCQMHFGILEKAYTDEVKCALQSQSCTRPFIDARTVPEPQNKY